MLVALKEWLITICTAVFFITAVEMVFPDNSMKKYAKFVLGLILITVFISPIIKIFDRNFDINTYTTSVIQNFDKNKTENEFKEYQEKSLNSTLEVFKLNLQTSCEKKLKEKYPENNYKVEAEASYDRENNEIVIKDIKIGVKEGSIEKIKKIQIGGDAKSVNSIDSMDSERSMDIKKYLSNELNISKDTIQIYKL